MKSIDKLYQFLEDQFGSDRFAIHSYGYAQGVAIAKLIEEEIERDYMRLPVDADGVPIRIGDVLDPPKGSEEYGRLMVTELTYDGEDWYFKGEIPASFTGQAGYFNVIGFAHVKPRTLENVLVDMLEAAIGYSDAHTDVALVAVEKYADEIRELLGFEIDEPDTIRNELDIEFVDKEGGDDQRD